MDDLFYDFTADELGIDPKNAAKIQEIKRLRPLSPRQPWGIFFVKFEPKRLPVVALRRILSQVALKKRASANSAERAAWACGRPALRLQLRRGRRAPDQLRPLLEGPGRPRPADPQGARLGQPRHGAAPRRRRQGADPALSRGPKTTLTSMLGAKLARRLHPAPPRGHHHLEGTLDPPGRSWPAPSATASRPRSPSRPTAARSPS